MKTKTIYTIKNDYDSNNAWDMYLDDLKNIVNYELKDKVYITHDNNKYRGMGISEYHNPNDDEPEEIEELRKEYPESFTVIAKGYSKGDYVEYTVNHKDNLSEEELSFLYILKEELSRVFTHKNDYFVIVKELAGGGWERVIDTLGFSITDIEFPDEDDVKRYLVEQHEIELSEDVEIICDIN